jgi:hypothetical protein
MVPFRIYYDGGATYAGPPWLAPVLGILVIIEKDKDNGRRIICNHDYYVWVIDRWIGVDHVGMIDYLIQEGPRRVLIGRMVTNEAFQVVYNKANSDQDFPLRTGYGCFERK